MAVPAHDSRDFAFARHFDLPIIQVVVPEGEEATDPATWEESKDSKSGVLINSGIITGLSVTDAIAKMKGTHHERRTGTGQDELSSTRCDLQPSALLGRALPHLL